MPPSSLALQVCLWCLLLHLLPSLLQCAVTSVSSGQGCTNAMTRVAGAPAQDWATSQPCFCAAVSTSNHEHLPQVPLLPPAQSDGASGPASREPGRGHGSGPFPPSDAHRRGELDWSCQAQDGNEVRSAGVEGMRWGKEAGKKHLIINMTSTFHADHVFRKCLFYQKTQLYK